MLIVALVITAWVSQRRFRRLVVGSTLAGVLLIVQIALGAIVVEFSLPGGVVLIHLANALLLLGVLVYVAVSASAIGTPEPRERAGRASLSKICAIAAGATYLLALSGALVVETKSSAGCNGWPLCGGGFQLPASQMDVIDMVHRTVAGVVVILIGIAMGIVLRRSRGDVSIRRWAIVVNLVLLLQIAAGALVVVLRLPAGIQALHIALASLLWATVVTVAVLARTREHAVVADEVQAQRSAPRSRTAGVAST